MFKNLTTKRKLFLFPIIFIVAILITSTIYSSSISYIKERIYVSSKTTALIDELLKGRIVIYQFMLNPTQKGKEAIDKQWSKLLDDTNSVKEIFRSKENKELATKTIDDIKSYIKDIDVLAKHSFATNKEETREEFAKTMQSMIKLIQSVEKNYDEMNLRNANSRDGAISSLTMNMLLVGLIATIIFIAISIFIANNIASSLNNFKAGLLSFFDFLNRKSDDVITLDQSSTNEFGEMAKLINENIDIVQDSVEKDNELIDEAKKVMTRVRNGWYSQTIDINTPNISLNEFKNELNKMIIHTKERFEHILIQTMIIDLFWS